nr:hypothetical protein [uncultured Rhodopila sp.]
MMPSCVALTTLTDRMRMDELARVAAAPFEAIEAGHCPVIVQDALETEGARHLHRAEADEAPYIVLPYAPLWSLAASHAILQMLADPTGAGRRAGASRMPGQGTVARAD